MLKILTQATAASSATLPSVFPLKAIIATVSDDETWKVWSVPNCDLLMSGEGHRDWISGVAFHPHGTMLATSAGDNTVKIWDFLQVRRTVMQNNPGLFELLTITPKASPKVSILVRDMLSSQLILPSGHQCLGSLG